MTASEPEAGRSHRANGNTAAPDVLALEKVPHDRGVASVCVDHEIARRLCFLAGLADEQADASFSAASAASAKLTHIKAGFEAALKQWSPRARWETRAELRNGIWRGDWRGAWTTPDPSRSTPKRRRWPILGPSDGVLEIDAAGHLIRVPREGIA
jgi:hypothetical protein